MKTIWLSFDVEATGPVAGLHSMLSLGIVAWAEADPGASAFDCVGTFSRNLQPLPDAGWDPDTRTWWNHPDRAEALAATTLDPQDPVDAMSAMMDFLEALPKGQHVWAAYPATFDMPFITYYANRFVRDWWFDFYRGNPIERIACFDMGSYAMHLLRCGYHDVSKRRMPPAWTDFTNPMPHVAINDATEQSHLLISMLCHGRGHGEPMFVPSLLNHPAMR